MVAMMRRPVNKKKVNSTASSRKSNGGSRHPLTEQVKALVQPFDSTPGAAKHLVEPLPSQAYKLKSRATITVGASRALVGFISPAFGDDGTPTNYPSAFFISGTGSEFSQTIKVDGTQAGTSPLKSGTTTGNFSSVAPVRPYRSDVIGGSWRLVSYALRMRYTGTAVNANGTLKYLPNDLGAFNYDDYATPQAALNFIDSNNHTILRSVYDKAVYDFSGLGSTNWMHGSENNPALHDAGGPYGETATQDLRPNHWCPVDIGQNSSPVKLGLPGMLVSYFNNSATAVQFEVELVENWEARTSTNTAFHTDSHGNPEISSEVFRTVVSGHMHAAASSAPTVIKSLKAVNSASKSPLGKLVIAAALS